MSDYLFHVIRPSDFRSIAKQEELLKGEGIERDRNLEYSIGLFDENYNIIATGSCFMNTLRCLAVERSHRGEGLMNELLTHLLEYETELGRTEIFIYTKCDAAKFFADLGFYEILRVDGKVVFMENRVDGFDLYLKRIKSETEKQFATLPIALKNNLGLPYFELFPEKKRISAIVMNANPFTNGHKYLVEEACASSDIVHLFVVSEDISFVPFKDRMKLIRENTKHLSNIIYHETGSFMISTATFPSYFLKDEKLIIESQAKLDARVFLRIAETLGIGRRFVGTEPFSTVTAIYNQVLKQELADSPVELIELERMTYDSVAISASKVRKLICDDRIEEIKPLLPQATYDYFMSPEAADVIRKIKSSSDVIHY